MIFDNGVNMKGSIAFNNAGIGIEHVNLMLISGNGCNIAFRNLLAVLNVACVSKQR